MQDETALRFCSIGLPSASLLLKRSSALVSLSCCYFNASVNLRITSISWQMAQELERILLLHFDDSVSASSENKIRRRGKKKQGVYPVSFSPLSVGLPAMLSYNLDLFSATLEGKDYFSLVLRISISSRSFVL